MYDRARTHAYVLSEYRLGFHLLRRHDMATAWFQGDDAELWERNMTALESIRVWPKGNSFDQSFNCLCSGYDDILELPS